MQAETSLSQTPLISLVAECCETESQQSVNFIPVLNAHMTIHEAARASTGDRGVTYQLYQD
jgi:hypothetical protein